MRARKIAVAFAMIALGFTTASNTWAADSAVPAGEQAKKQLKQKPAAKNINKQARKKPDAQDHAPGAATQKESKKYETLSNASKSRHDKPMNSIRNMR